MTKKMRITKTLEKEVKKVYEAYFDNYIKGNVDAITFMLDDEYNQIGSAESEVFFNKKDAVKFLYDTIDQVAGITEIRNRILKVEPIEDLILVTDLFDIYALIENDWSFYSKFRASTLMQKKNDGWKFIHQHSSMPDTRTQDGENIAIEKIADENQQLREAVKRRTIELEHKNQELETEAALERVRVRSMSMQTSEELAETAVLLFEQYTNLVKLSENSRTYISIFNEEMTGADVWMTLSEGQFRPGSHFVEFSDHPHVKKVLNTFKNKDSYTVRDFSGTELNEFLSFLSTFSHAKSDDGFKKLFSSPPERLVYTDSFFSRGSIGVITDIPLEENAINILKRFAKVFDQSYTRFLDLQKAEAQAREAKIEAALERVRSRSMAMHSSDEFVEASDVMFDQLKKLRIKTLRIGIGIMNTENNTVEIWSRSEIKGKAKNKILGVVPAGLHPIFDNMVKAWKENKPFFSSARVGDEVKEYYEKLATCLSYPEPKEFNERESVTTFFFAQGSLNVISLDPLSEEECNIMIRFAQVFGQIYQRFLDLKNAEAQAREAKIEAALERVRSKAMAMHSSEDLAQTVDTFFSELKGLKVAPHRSGVGIINPESRSVNIHATTATQANEIKTVVGKLKLSGHPILDSIYKNWKLQKEYHPILHGNEILEYYKVMNPQVTFPDFAGDEVQYGYYFYFKEGGVFAWTDRELAESDLQIFRRYTSVLSLTYRRYIDLKEAEARAREAEQQASLDRVRGEIASMRTTEDLEKITPLIWGELTNLDIKFFRCGVFIIDETSQIVQAYLTTPSGKPLAALHLPFGSTQLVSKAVKYWREHKVYKEDWNREQFISWAASLVEHGYIKNTDHYQDGEKPPESLSLQFLPFAYGMLYVGSAIPLTKGENHTAQRLADSFGIAYSRYMDFQKLEAANQRKSIELEEARQLQMAMLPKELPNLPNLDIAVYMKTATEVGGDYYDFKVGEDGTLTAVIGDATGHGMKAGTIVTITKSLFNSLAHEEDILDAFSKISKVIKDMKFRQLSMCLLMLKIRGDELKISSAAMPPALIYRKKAHSVEEIELRGMPLGAMEKFPYSLKQAKLNHGDVVLLISDGLPELANSKGEMFGYEKAKKEFLYVGEKNPIEIVDHFKKTVSKWVNDNDPDDDITFVAIKVK
jgi:serine phosphatase RsbU (regulator of sigma subunit)/ketosteroid isomerase-like protein